MNQRNANALTIGRMLVLAAFSLSSLNSLAQTNIAVAPIKLNVLYIGVDNPVSVAASASTDEKVTVSLSGCEGTVSKTAAGIYNVRVASVSDNCQLNVYVDGKLAGSSAFRVRSLPRPNATIGGLASGAKINAENLRKQPGIAVYVKDFPFEVKYEVLGFTVQLVDDKGNPTSVDCQGAVFSSQVKQNIEQYAKPGDIVTIQNIMVKDPSGKEVKVPALVYTIE